jgi:hypothetical protein
MCTILLPSRCPANGPLLSKNEGNTHTDEQGSYSGFQELGEYRDRQTHRVQSDLVKLLFYQYKESKLKMGIYLPALNKTFNGLL